MPSPIHMPSPILVNMGDDNGVDTLSANMILGAVATRSGNDNSVDTLSANMILGAVATRAGNDNSVDTATNMILGAVATRSGNDNSVDTATNMILGAVATRAGNDNSVDTLSPERGVALKTREKTKKPPLYKVLMLNDDYTPMEFVVLVLQHFFRKSLDEATHIMLMIHQKGVGVCGVYTHEVAETKAKQVMALARQNEHPLQVQIEKE